MIKEKKPAYFKKLMALFDDHSKIFLVNCDMVGSKQVQNVRMALRGKGEMIMGKNTMIRKCLRDNVEQYPHLECLIPVIEGNSAFIFVKKDFDEVRAVIKQYYVGAAARAGVIAQCSVTIPAGVTTLQPTETSFFQALNISTKITKGAIEILNDIELIKEGRKVNPGEAALLQKLGIKPFTYGLDIMTVYDNGSCFDASVLDITDDDILKAFQSGINNIAALCLAAGYPTIASVTHSFLNGYKNVLAIALSTDYTYPLAQKIKDFLSDPEAMAAAAAASAAPAAGGAAPAAKAKEAEPEPEEEEEEDVDFDLFD